jgi:tRNA(Ile)-lysidine synthase
MAFSPQQLISLLPEGESSCLLGFSGGLDSHVLLHSLCLLRDSADTRISLKAIHIHHGLSPNADLWADHCRGVCAAYKVPLEVCKVSVENSGQGLENAARNARLGIFQEKLKAGEYLLTGHHLDDQMETMLFRMMRGTGLRGLSGISLERPLGKGKLLRPLLGVDRTELKLYAEQQGLEWIEDESNAFEDFDRNYLRQKVMPLLSSRWPGYRKNWQRLAQLAEEGQFLQRELGMQDLVKVQSGIHRLDIACLLKFSPVRQRNIVRQWFLSLEESDAIPAPDYYVVERLFEELIPAATDASPMLTWEKAGLKVEVRRYASRIYLVLPEQISASADKLSWDTSTPLQLPGHLGNLSLIESSEDGIALIPGETLEVGFKQGGETVKPAGRKTRPMKKILPDYGVPPWLREKTPFIFRKGELLAVADLFVCDQHQVKFCPDNDKKMFKLQWLRSDLHCGY